MMKMIAAKETTQLRTTRVGRVAMRQRDTRIRLLVAAHGLMSEAGVDATTIQEITERADVAFGSFYNYFDSKHAIAAEALDCVIDNLGQRNDLVTAALAERDPVRIVANSVRLVAREMLANPMWHWWIGRPDLVVNRMRQGFRPYGHRDFELAAQAGELELVRGNLDLAWSQLIWLLAGGVKDILDGVRAIDTESYVTEAVLRVLGVPLAKAAQATSYELPSYPELPIDFSFVSR
jgi:AcrR family transcriptional regulator